jgi:superoxide dismutase, Cu-Zn family
MSANCVCALQSESGSSVHGVLSLSQASEDAPTVISGELKGLAPGKHGISINVYGDLSDGATSCGEIFNPFGQPHGFPGDATRKVGSLGNIIAGEDGKAYVEIEDTLVKLVGPHSVIGRSIIVYAAEDDGGRGGHENSLITGNSGPRVAAGVVGLASSNA